MQQHPSSNFLYTLTCHYVNRGNINCILCILRFVITTLQLRSTGVQYSCKSVFPVSAKGFVRCTGICLGTRLRETHCASRFTRRSAIRLHTSLHTNQLVLKTPWGGRRIVKTKSKYFSFLFFFCGRVSFKHCLISIEGAPGTKLRIQLFVTKGDINLEQIWDLCACSRGCRKSREQVWDLCANSRSCRKRL